MAPSADPQRLWAPYAPDAQEPWTPLKVAHLHRRAGFGVRGRWLEEGLDLGPQRLVDRVLQGEPRQREVEANFDARLESLGRGNDVAQASAWWLARMVQSAHPLREKLALFWHNHFATSYVKVQSVGRMLGQYALFYAQALGDFRVLLQQVSRDPAMMVWLDTVQSKKAKPNENYARELMELFSLGIGNYTERDIREAARAFTGWEIHQNAYRFNPREHDGTMKRVFGREGPFTGEQVVDLCLGHDACAPFIVGKLFRFLVSEAEEPTPELLAPLVAQFRKDFSVAGVVETMLRSRLFFSPRAYRQKIKSPVEFAVGLVSGMEAKLGTAEMARELAGLGQDLFQPPSVKGWDGGAAWLNAQTLLTRHNLALSVCQSRRSVEGTSMLAPRALCAQNRVPAGAPTLQFLLERFLQNDVSPDARRTLQAHQEQLTRHAYPAHWSAERREDHVALSLAHVVLTLPEYQLN